MIYYPELKVSRIQRLLFSLDQPYSRITSGTEGYCCCLVAKSCSTICYPMECNLLGSAVRGISQARILEWVPISLSKDLPDPGIELMSHICGQILYCCTTREPRYRMCETVSLSVVSDYSTPWTIARQAPLSMEFWIGRGYTHFK